MEARLKQDALLRLKTLRGHLDGVIRLVEQDAYCVDVMKQIAACQASLERVNQTLLRNHLNTCVTEAVKRGEGPQAIDELMDIMKYSKSLTDGRLCAVDLLPDTVPTAELAASGPAGAREKD